MEELYHQILKRNALETTPFLSVHAANASLQNLVDALQSKCEALERECADQQQMLDDQRLADGSSSPKNKSAALALKNEARLRDKMEKLQEELNEKLRIHADDSAKALQITKELSDMKDLNTAQEKTISNLKDQNDRNESAIEHLTNELQEAQSRTKLAEQQYTGLKDTIRTLQVENDQLTKENGKMVDRLVKDKEKVTAEVNVLNELVEKLKKEVQMLRTLQKQEDRRKTGWFGKMVGSEADAKENGAKKSTGESSSRRFGMMGVVVPSSPKFTIQAHSAEACCVRYDGSGTDLVATASNDSTIKVWDTGSGSTRATLRGGSGHTLASCDIFGGLVVGGGSDKTCRVWNLRTERMIHHLVGHAHKITCVRLFDGGKSVLSGSADRCVKVWDIARGTYRQTVSLRHSSTTNCIDVGADPHTAVTGHNDGGLRFWDLRSGERTADIPSLHEGGVTSVQFHPSIGTQLLTNGKDSTLKVVDVRTCTAIHTMEHPGFRTSFNYSSSSLSPDGTYAASGSSSTGDIFVWRVVDGSLATKLSAHKVGVGGFAWGRGGSNGQQVASADRNGVLILWA